MTYKCIKTLRTETVEVYYGNTISEHLYKKLVPKEKLHFVKLEKDFVPQKKKLDDTIYPDGRDFDYQNLTFQSSDFSPNDDSYSSQSNSDSGSSNDVDYGGGTSEGGGSDGNY